MKISQLLMAAAVTLVISGTAFAQSAPVKKADGILVTSGGQTVYTFDKDVADNGKSACYGGCATAWPPVAASDAALTKPYSTITRDDGVKQVTYNGKPLYLFASDKMVGDRKGDNAKSIWHVVKD